MATPTDAPPPSTAALFGPVIGFFNLSGPAAEADLAADRAALAPLFRGQTTSNTAPPRCDVLFLYASIDADGRVRGSNLPLIELVKACSARFAVVASTIDPNPLRKAAAETSDWVASIVFTLDRKGATFPTFFHSLFEKMFEGTTFALAWVELSPQIPGLRGDDMPATVALPRIPNLIFQPDWFPNKIAPSPSEIEPVAKEIIAEMSPGSNPREPSLFSALGAAMGYSVIPSIRLGKYVPNGVSQANKNFLLEVKGKDGRTYWFGDLINGLLFERAVGRLDAWQVIEAKLKSLAAPIPDLIPIVRNNVLTIGGGDFGVLKLPEALTPREQPIVSLRAHWPAVQRILETHGRRASGWPIDLACAIVLALDAARTISPTDAARIAMEAAIPMSKLPELP